MPTTESGEACGAPSGAAPADRGTALPLGPAAATPENFSDAGPITSPTAAADAHDGTDDYANAKTPTPEATATVPLTATTTPPSAKFSHKYHAHNQATP